MCLIIILEIELICVNIHRHKGRVKDMIHDFYAKNRNQSIEPVYLTNGYECGISKRHVQEVMGLCEEGK